MGLFKKSINTLHTEGTFDPQTIDQFYVYYTLIPTDIKVAHNDLVLLCNTPRPCLFQVGV